MTKKSLLVVLSALALSTVWGCQSDPPLEVASSVNLEQIQGKWYEIARLPRTTQVDCHGTTAFYARAADGSLKLVNQCNVGSATGPLQSIAMTATVPDKSTPAKLALDVGGYTGDYWILEVGASYEYLVVGHPSRLYLWVLSRTPTLDANLMGDIVARAQAENFDTSRLEYTPQPPPGDRLVSDSPVGSVPAPPHTGCALCVSAFNTSECGAVWGFVGLAGAVIALRRRRRSGLRLPLRRVCEPATH
ncbi:MAG TPA: lipocalin family protein [Polyangiaceae bacterium]